MVIVSSACWPQRVQHGVHLYIYRSVYNACVNEWGATCTPSLCFIISIAIYVYNIIVCCIHNTRLCADHLHDIVLEYPLNLSISLGGGGHTNKYILGHGEWTGMTSSPELPDRGQCVVCMIRQLNCRSNVFVTPATEGDCPPYPIVTHAITAFIARVVFFWIWMQSGGTAHQHVNICPMSIANKYHEGVVERTLEI